MEKNTPDKKPRGDQEGKDWAIKRAGNIGKAIADARHRLGISALELSAKTKVLGYPITRGTIAKIESNSRGGKLDLAEILVLSAALDVAPLALIFPGFPDESFYVLPKYCAQSYQAWSWASNTEDYDPWLDLASPTVEQTKDLMDAIEDYDDAVHAFERRYHPVYNPELKQWDAYGIPNYRSSISGEIVSSSTTDTGMNLKKSIALRLEMIRELAQQVSALGGTVLLPLWVNGLKKEVN